MQGENEVFMLMYWFWRGNLKESHCSY